MKPGKMSNMVAMIQKKRPRGRRPSEAAPAPAAKKRGRPQKWGGAGTQVRVIFPADVVAAAETLQKENHGLGERNDYIVRLAMEGAAHRGLIDPPKQMTAD